jgi:REP-associated tyrosine transposase
MERTAIIRRRLLRLKDYDYANPGAYFLTICTHDRSMLFGDINEGNIATEPPRQDRLSGMGDLCDDPSRITLDAFVIMPNHVHGIMVIEESDVGATGRSPSRSGPAPRSLGAFVGGFKSATTKQLNDLRRTPGQPVWQRNYYEHMIRDEGSLNRIREYIAGNPARWDVDRENPAANNPEPNNVWCGLD